MAAELAVGMGGVGVGMATHKELGHHQRHAQQGDGQDIDKDEGGSAVVACLNGETPDIAEADGTACRCHDDAEFASERSAL